jgi:hypothetical protein
LLSQWAALQQATQVPQQQPTARGISNLLQHLRWSDSTCCRPAVARGKLEAELIPSAPATDERARR